MGLFSFFLKAGEFSEIDPEELERTGESAEQHANYHRRIVSWAVVCAVCGVVLGTIGSVQIAGDPRENKDLRLIVSMPFLFATGGAILGVALACLFAPGEFLTGPLGSRWMRLIGTKSVLVARIVCLLCGLIGIVLSGGLAILMALGKA